jgi:hypothetical protein
MLVPTLLMAEPRSDRLVLTQWTGGYNRGKAIVHVVTARGGEALATLSPLDAQSVNAPGSCWRAGRRRRPVCRPSA